jgi:hypothetical protein
VEVVCGTIDFVFYFDRVQCLNKEISVALYAGVFFLKKLAESEPCKQDQGMKHIPAQLQ